MSLNFFGISGHIICLLVFLKFMEHNMSIVLVSLKFWEHVSVSLKFWEHNMSVTSVSISFFAILGT